MRDHDVVLVPHGYHGPCMAAPDYPMYYLNVMAGPGRGALHGVLRRPRHAWIRDTWEQGPTRLGNDLTAPEAFLSHFRPCGRAVAPLPFM